MALATGIRVALLPGMTGSAIMEYSDLKAHHYFEGNYDYEKIASDGYAKF